jgi:small subunit ribosomal protein SAe
MKESDVQMMLAADVHLGTKNCDFQGSFGSISLWG